ncbi:Transmembrane protein [Toxocara canis]|uniref:Transmembrane protein n=1 Tax=Toxocara canis TaxID=6265 RepID=A0A0B2W0W5_TOXCA|nr:Transmembrane protein [Toxocara canis]
MKVKENAYFSGSDEIGEMEVDPSRRRFPVCIVWAPIPLLTWLFPFIGHMGIATSRGVIRDFAGSYCVNEDDMAFGWPTRYLKLDVDKVVGGAEAWDRAVRSASDEYKGHVHNLICDNCHSHVALALNEMRYAQRRNYNMIYLGTLIFFKARYVGFGGFLKQWLPALVFAVFLVYRIAPCTSLSGAEVTAFERGDCSVTSFHPTHGQRSCRPPSLLHGVSQFFKDESEGDRGTCLRCRVLNILSYAILLTHSFFTLPMRSGGGGTYISNGSYVVVKLNRESAELMLFVIPVLC